MGSSSRVRCLLLLAVLALAAFGPWSVPARGAEAPESRPVRIEVDASEVGRRLLHSRLVIPAVPGPLTLYYPEWIPGEHGPTGPITDLAGLRIAARGKTISWRRDEEEMYAFHCEVP